MGENEGHPGGSVLVQRKGKMSHRRCDGEAEQDAQSRRGQEEQAARASTQSVQDHGNREDGGREAEGAEDVRPVKIRTQREMRAVHNKPHS